jgi:hypothetical protein
MLERQRKSGLSVREFCTREDLSISACSAWRRIVQQRDLEQQPRAVASAAPAFLPVVLAETGGRDAGGRITIELRGGRTMLLPASMPPEQLAAVVRAIENLSLDREAA